MIKTLWAVEVKTSRGFVICFDQVFLLHVYKTKREAMNVANRTGAKSRVVKFLREVQK
jgi:hypothetical protein